MALNLTTGMYQKTLITAIASRLGTRYSGVESGASVAIARLLLREEGGGRDYDDHRGLDFDFTVDSGFVSIQLPREVLVLRRE